MRHVRMLGLCLIAVCGLAALGATSASAVYKEVTNPEECKAKLPTEITPGSWICETQKERELWLAYADCPEEAAFGEPNRYDLCAEGGTTYKPYLPTKSSKEYFEYREEQGTVPQPRSHFTAGNVTVNLRLPILLRGGLTFEGAEEDPVTEELIFPFVGPSNGVPAIQPVAQSAPPLSKDVDTALLSERELATYNFYAHTVKETQTYATVELAGPASAIKVSTGNLLEEQDVAFSFPVKVHLINPFVGENCYVGSDANPIVVNFTTGQSGALKGSSGSVSTVGNLWAAITSGTVLVNNTFEAPGVEGCGVEGGADAAVDAALGLPSASGNSAVLNGRLQITDLRTVQYVFAHNEF